MAVKVLEREKMKTKVDLVMNEKNILNKISHPLCVSGYHTFQNDKYLFMVMEFMKGGDFEKVTQEICLNEAMI